MAEGSMWEAIQHAAWEGLDNLTAIIDVNRLGQTRETMLGWDVDAYVQRLTAFGWHAIAVDGHDVEEIERAYAEAETIRERPAAIVARTLKGRGVKAVEDQPGKHGKPLDDAEAAIEELGGERSLRVELAEPAGGARHEFEAPGADLPTWELGEEVATRKAYGEALAALGSRRGDVVALDGEVSNSTHSEDFREAHPERYFEMFIAEQQMVAAAVGFQVRGWVPFASTFAAFLSRAYDFVRMAAISRADIRLSGSHAGVSIGEDGPSQMALEDIAAFRAVNGSTVLHPSDANQTSALVAAMADQSGISFLRTLRGKTPVRTPADEDVRIGGSRVAHEGDDVAVIACGITVDEAVRAAEALEGDVAVRVLDCYSVKPIDVEAVRAAARECGAVVTVEDHWPEGGLGDAVLEALADADERPAVTKLAVREMPVSGSRRSCCAKRASTRRRSPPPSGRSSARGRRSSPARRRSRRGSLRRGAPRRHGRCRGTGRRPHGPPRSPAPSVEPRRPCRSARGCLRGSALRGPCAHVSASGRYPGAWRRRRSFRRPAAGAGSSTVTAKRPPPRRSSTRPGPRRTTTADRPRPAQR
jgi:transketolase